MSDLTRKAYAKINLGLDVIGVRDNGYHDVKMIMQTIGIVDILEFTKLSEDKIILTVDDERLPGDESNLVYKAVALMKEIYHVKEGLEIHLEKHIPMAAGMAGGSADCAEAIIAANELFGLNLTVGEMCEIGVRLGADVPYCIRKGTVLSEGIGEVLTTLKPMPDCYILVAKPPIDVSTKFVYEHLDAQPTYDHPDIDGMVDAIMEGNLNGITSRMGNVLEDVTVPAYPIVNEIKEHMKKLGAMNAMMSGSGPTVFGIFDDARVAADACTEITATGYTKEVFLVKPYQV